MQSPQVKTLLSIGIVIVLTIGLHFLGWLRPVENILRSTIQPGSKLLYNLSIKINQQKLPFQTAEEFLDSYNKLNAEVEVYRQKAIQFDRVSEENKTLRDELHFFTSTTYSNVGAEVIGKNIESFANTIILSRGQKDGVEIGNPVIVGEGILIGKIFRVEKDVSVARLLNDQQSKVAATVLNQSKSIGLVEGGYGISVRMNFIPQNELIAPGDVVITSGLEEQTPRGLIIGTVQTVEKEAYEPFQKAVLTPDVDLDKIFMASILIKKPS